MATTTGPAMSFGARGKLAKSIVYSSWKGVNVVRKYVTPANPKSVEQMKTRDVFMWLHDQFKFMPADVTAAWAAYVKGQPLTPANAFLQANIKNLRGAANSAAIIMVKPVLGGPPTATITGPLAVATHISVTITAPALPPGWTIVQGTVGIMKRVTVFAEQEVGLTQTSDIASPGPYVHDFTGLTTGDHYIAFGFFKMLRADLLTAYGGQLSADWIVP